MFILLYFAGVQTKQFQKINKKLHSLPFQSVSKKTYCIFIMSKFKARHMVMENVNFHIEQTLKKNLTVFGMKLSTTGF